MSSVLVVDDEPMAVRVVKLGLEKAGYEVVTAPNGEEALGKLHERRFDVLVTDLNMPRLDGRELCLAVRAMLPDREPLIFLLTARPGLDLREWAEELDHVELLEKPASLHRLINRIRERLAAKTTAAPEPA